MNERTWDLVSYTPDLAEEVADLARRTWGEAEITNLDYHRWQYVDNPAGPVMAFLARDRETQKIVGQEALIPIQVDLDGVPTAVMLSLNTTTDPAYRRRGIFGGVVRSANESLAPAGMAFVYGIPNQNSYAGFIGLGWYLIGDVPLLVRPVNLRRLVAQRIALPGVAPLAAIAGRALAPTLPKTPQPVEGVSITPVEQFDASFDGLWQRIRGRQRVMVVRDSTYLSWRFHQIPLRRYDCFKATTAEHGLAGYIILREAEISGMQAGLIVDFLIDSSPAGERAGRALLSQALAHFSSQEIDLLGCLMLPHAPEYRLLRRASFRPCPKRLLPQPFPLIAHGGEEMVRDLRNWFITMGDYDAV